jgi:hypothetical protein
MRRRLSVFPSVMSADREYFDQRPIRALTVLPSIKIGRISARIEIRREVAASRRFAVRAVWATICLPQGQGRVIQIGIECFFKDSSGAGRVGVPSSSMARAVLNRQIFPPTTFFQNVRPCCGLARQAFPGHIVAALGFLSASFRQMSQVS